jgi:soluble lytic murein transglycosylase
VAQDGDVARARALFEQGMREVGLRHLRLVRARAGNDALRLYAYAHAANEMGGYWDGMSAVETLPRVLDVSFAELPVYVQMLGYPRPYRDLVEDAARRYGIETALFYAIMRQESRFEPSSRSPANARGLAQVVPATASSIATALGWTRHTAADLYKPYVSVEFGAYYLAQQLRRFDGQAWAALAAYNAGPGAVGRWRAASSDPDLQIEAVDYDETVQYLRRVMAHWGMYRILYPDLSG